MYAVVAGCHSFLVLSVVKIITLCVGFGALMRSLTKWLTALFEQRISAIIIQAHKLRTSGGLLCTPSICLSQ